MKERQEWMNQFMKEFEEKMDAKFNRSEKSAGNAVAKQEETHDVVENHTEDRQSTKPGRTLKICVDSNDGDKVRVNLPLKFGRMMISKGSKLSGKWTESLDEEDLNMMMDMIDKGHVGEIVNVQSSDGDSVIIKVV